MGQDSSAEQDPTVGQDPTFIQHPAYGQYGEELEMEPESATTQSLAADQKPTEGQEPEMDSVEKLFEDLGGPHGRNISDSLSDNKKLQRILEEFLGRPASKDPDYQYLVKHAKKSFVDGPSNTSYLRQQLAHLAIQKTFSRKDQSFKARQLKYHRWLALGMKSESYPFQNRDPNGMPSTTRIGVLVNPTACASCGKRGANMRCPNCCSLQDEAHVLEKTAYCNKKCVQDHYKAHQKDHMFRRLHEATYMYRLAKIYRKNGLLYLIDENWDRAGITGRHVFIPPPKGLAESEEMYLGLLLWAQAEEVKLSPSFLIDYILQPVCKEIKIVYTQTRNVLSPHCQMSADGKVTNLNLHRHTVLKLTLRSDETYVLDLSAPQFGWKETLAPWDAWTNLRAFISDSEPFRSGSKKAIESTAELTGLDKEQQVARTKLMKEIVKEVRNIKDLGETLNADDHDFQQTKYMFTRMIENKIFLVIKNEYHKPEYRLWLCGAPNYGVRVSKSYTNVLKELWINPKEYDKLKESGTDMRKWWGDRIDGKLKDNLDTSGLTIVTGTSPQPLNLRDLTNRQK
ncbi:hypothetical protein F5Y08DRAFT_334644 [Xylaria arbuscula]|uniref:MYND-type zinc finger protein samB n=1 Tax=Xylaria arbuscula TaxID=114810 RepID=A0A9W8NHK9_9PEZI|nr:hypothetical protein F5Y08DRAFT_334644 [Xylaria arbuscula]KAJ3575885.1 hypothetical protein NPX13_g3879 [Xylaria arbuscula]